MTTALELRHSCLFSFLLILTGVTIDRTAAAFLEFYVSLAAWLRLLESRGSKGNDTLLAPGEVYHNSLRLGMWYKSSDSS